jgi:hypothetical protein
LPDLTRGLQFAFLRQCEINVFDNVCRHAEISRNSTTT